jgi:uncharacterized membrane protein YedE/YeeE
MTMRAAASALVVGVIFGAGLALSDMINPARVLAFLDVAGTWDPTLAFVMGGAIIPTVIAFAMRPHLTRPLLAGAFSIPENRTPDRRLLIGSALFGVGWGLVGFCPGPAISGLVFGLWQPWLFVAAMLTGMLAERLLPLQLVPQPRSPAST